MRTLYVVPRMYTIEEMRLILLEIPEDYSSKVDEFWKYVEDKLNPLRKIIKHVYRDMVTVGSNEGLEYINEVDERCHKIIETLIDSGARLEVTEDSDLVAEAESWVGLMGSRGLSHAAMELFRENLEERNSHIAKVITETLKPDEAGVLFIEPSRKVNFPSDFKIIKMCPFEPIDYVNTLQTKRRASEKKG